MDGRQPPVGRRGDGSIGPSIALLVSVLTAVAAVVAFWLDASGQVVGGLVGISLLTLGAGLVWWARWAMPDEQATDPREELASSAEERAELAATLALGSESISRRRLLVGAVVGVAAAYTAFAVSLLRSLAPNPDPVLRNTAWAKGARVVTASGTSLKPADLRVGGVLTVYPEGHVGDADAQTLLIRLSPGQLELPDGRESWAAQDVVAYSKVCTHAGCPVGLYQGDEHLLLCPCHQSTFDVLRGAEPTSGPAARPLPQLPIEVDADGYLVAQSDYRTPIGPGFWNMKGED